MPGHWIRATRVTACVSSDCARSMLRDAPVYLVAGGAANPVCASCALRRFGHQPPADLPRLTPIVASPAPPSASRLRVSDAGEPTVGWTDAAWGSVARKAKGERDRLQRLQALNDVDGKLRQIGGDR